MNYSTLSQRAYYSGLSPSDCTFITQFNGKNRLDANIFFIDGEQQHFKAKSLDRLSLHLITKIPKLKYNKLDLKVITLLCTSIILSIQILFQILKLYFRFYLLSIFIILTN